MNPVTDKPTLSDEDSLRTIALQAGVTEAMVRARHLQEKLHLENGACIRDFIPLLALKHVREIFRQPADTQPAAGSRHEQHGARERTHADAACGTGMSV